MCAIQSDLKSTIDNIKLCTKLNQTRISDVFLPFTSQSCTLDSYSYSRNFESNNFGVTIFNCDCILNAFSFKPHLIKVILSESVNTLLLKNWNFMQTSIKNNKNYCDKLLKTMGSSKIKKLWKINVNFIFSAPIRY